jgi:hypothetical protein
MASLPQVVLSAIQFGQVYPPYDGSSTTFSSLPYKGNGYYGYTDGLHTITYSLSGFIGIINFQATLATNPSESDWFDVANTSLGDGTNAVNGTSSYNFFGNFVWCRAHITNFSSGQINRVLYNT